MGSATVPSAVFSRGDDAITPRTCLDIVSPILRSFEDRSLANQGETVAVEIVRLDSENVGLLEHIAPEVFDYEIKDPYLDAFMSDPRHTLFLATEDGTVVGMTSSFEYFHPDKPPQLFINEVGVALTHRRRGIGRRLVEATMEFAKGRGCVYAWLGTDSDNESGRACFGSVPNGADPQSFLLYEWELED